MAAPLEWVKRQHQNSGGTNLHCYATLINRADEKHVLLRIASHNELDGHIVGTG